MTKKRGDLRAPLASLRCGTDAKGANASCDGNSGHEAPSVPDGVCEETGTADRVRCAGVSIIWAFQKAGKDGAAGLFWTSGKPDAHGTRLVLPSRERLREGGQPRHASCRLSRLVASEEDLQIFKEVNGPLIVPGLMMKQP